jgi:hypothetical protein
MLCKEGIYSIACYNAEELGDRSGRVLSADSEFAAPKAMMRSTLPWRPSGSAPMMLKSPRYCRAATRSLVVRALSTSAPSLYAKAADDGPLSSLKPGSSSKSAASTASSSPDAQSRTGGSGANAAGGRDWQPRRTAPLATAQTLTLFSTSPDALLLTLRSTLHGMLSSLARGASVQGQAGHKPLEQIDAQPAVEDGKTFTLLFALSKDLPQEALGRAVGLLRGEESTNKEAGIDHRLSEKFISTRLGVLSSPVPASLIPPQVLNPAAPPLAPYSTLHSIALSLLPASHAVPFRSKIRGKQISQVGRWPDKKDSWKDVRGKVKADMIGEMAEGGQAKNGGIGTTAETDASPETPGWRKVWGKENIFSELPAELERFASEAQKESLLSTILFSDPSPQGLLEGFDVQFPHASHVGAIAPATPFETGRDQTIFFRRSSVEDEISSEGAVGLALIGSKAEAARGLKVSTKFEGLKELGPRRRMTGARGNIISSLEDGNATQQFLRDIQALSSDNKKSQAGTAMDKDEARDISKGMNKEDEYYLGVFDEHTDGKVSLYGAQSM